MISKEWSLCVSVFLPPWFILSYLKVTKRSYFVPTEVLDLSNNLLIGSIPDKIGDAKKIRILDLSNNSLNGALPNSLGKMKDAKQVILSLNLIEGTIPIDIRKMKNLGM